MVPEKDFGKNPCLDKAFAFRNCNLSRQVAAKRGHPACKTAEHGQDHGTFHIGADVSRDFNGNQRHHGQGQDGGWS